MTEQHVTLMVIAGVIGSEILRQIVAHFFSTKKKNADDLDLQIKKELEQIQLLLKASDDKLNDVSIRLTESSTRTEILFTTTNAQAKKIDQNAQEILSLYKLLNKN